MTRSSQRESRRRQRRVYVVCVFRVFSDKTEASVTGSCGEMEMRQEDKVGQVVKGLTTIPRSWASSWGQ